MMSLVTIGQITGIQIEAAIMIVWIIIILAIGLWARSRIKGSGEFMVGGRAIPVWMLGMWSAGAAVSAWAFFGLPGTIYASGPINHWALCLPMMAGFALTVLIMGRWMRVSARKYGLMTIPDFLGEVYSGKWIRVFAAIGIVIACVFYATAQFKAIGILFGSLFGLPYIAAAALGIAITVIYVFLGGFIAGAIINAFNVSMMIVASLIAIGLAYTWSSGYGNMVSVIINGVTLQPGTVLSNGTVLTQPYTSAPSPNFFDPNTALGGNYWFFWFSWAILIASFGLIGQPAIVQKLYGIKKPSTLWVWGLLGALIFGITCPAYCYLGEVTKYLAVMDPSIITAISKMGYGSDGVIAWLTTVKLAAESPYLGGLLIAGVLAAAWSTIDGFLMMGGAAVARDILNKCFKPNWTDKQLLFQLRLWMVIVGVIMVIETLFPADIITWLAAIGWAQFAATLAPALILAVLWKGITKHGGAAGVLAGLLTAFIMTVVWRLPKSALAPYGLGTVGFIQTFKLDAGAWGMIVGFVVIILVSLVTVKSGRGPLYYDIHKITPPAKAPVTPVPAKAAASAAKPQMVYDSYTKTWFEVDPASGKKTLVKKE
jgi:Na+/proline symporter